MDALPFKITPAPLDRSSELCDYHVENLSNHFGDAGPAFAIISNSIFFGWEIRSVELASAVEKLLANQTSPSDNQAFEGVDIAWAAVNSPPDIQLLSESTPPTSREVDWKNEPVLNTLFELNEELLTAGLIGKNTDDQLPQFIMQLRFDAKAAEIGLVLIYDAGFVWKYFNLQELSGILNSKRLTRTVTTQFLNLFTSLQ